MTQTTADARTPGLLGAASAYSSVVGVPLVTSEGRRVANTALPGMPKEWDDQKKQAVIDAAFIAHAWNCHDDLVKALNAADQWIRLLAKELDIDPSDTTVTISAVGPDGKRELAKVSLAETQLQVRAALAAAKGAGQ